MNKITKKFLDGNLEGLTHTFNTFHGFELNKIYSDCVTGAKYQIIEVENIAVEDSI